MCIIFIFQVTKKWGEYSYDVQFILQRSPLDPNKTAGGTTNQQAALPPNPSTSNASGGVGVPFSGPSFSSPEGVKSAPWVGGDMSKSGAASGGIWKSPPVVGGVVGGSNRIKPDAARLSPDSG